MPEAVSRMVASYTIDIVKQHVTQSQEELSHDDLQGILASWNDVRPDMAARATLGILSNAMLSILDEPVAETVTA